MDSKVTFKNQPEKICASSLYDLAQRFKSYSCEQSHKHEYQSISVKVTKITQMLNAVKMTAKNSTKILQAYQQTYKKLKGILKQKIEQHTLIKKSCQQLLKKSDKLIQDSIFPNINQVCQKIEKMSAQLQIKHIYDQDYQNAKKISNLLSQQINELGNKNDIFHSDLTPIKIYQNQDTQYKDFAVLISDVSTVGSEIMKSPIQSIHKQIENFNSSNICSNIGKTQPIFTDQHLACCIASWAIENFIKKDQKNELWWQKYIIEEIIAIKQKHYNGSETLNKQPRLKILKPIKSIIDKYQNLKQYIGKKMNDSSIPFYIRNQQINLTLLSLGTTIIVQSSEKAQKLNEYYTEFFKKCYIPQNKRQYMFNYLNAIIVDLLKAKEKIGLKKIEQQTKVVPIVPVVPIVQVMQEKNKQKLKEQSQINSSGQSLDLRSESEQDQYDI